MIRFFILFLLLTINLQIKAFAQTSESNNSAFLYNFDPFANEALSDTNDEQLDELKSADQLITEADYLLEDQRLLDGRTKLMRALKKDPTNYRAYMLLSGYYLVHVGHFKLSLRYIRKAIELFEQKNSKPPYSDKLTRLEHGQLLYLLSQSRLNLDDYNGSLRILDEFENYGYQAGWYSATRAWTLMKLGKVSDAIKVAKEGVTEGKDLGRTLNMLGILLSMSGQPEEALKIFKEAIAYEFSMGSLGQPATPLNNSGEVFKEMFLDDRAESNWIRAGSLPDGCEHFLPTLNLSLLYFEQLNLNGVKRAIKTFEECIAQYPLRNGEEHKALLAFTKGKVMELSGNPEKALKFYDIALKSRQWFGKIGTSQDDLEVALFAALSKSYEALYQRFKFKLSNNLFESYSHFESSIKFKVYSWWYKRQSRRMLIDVMKSFEDVNIRNTDSMLEYPTLGMIAGGISPTNLARRIDLERINDKRPEATTFYQSYLAESLINHGKVKDGIFLLDKTIPLTRDKYDLLLKSHLLSLRLKTVSFNSDDYLNLSSILFNQSPYIFRNYGFALPVTLSTSNESYNKIVYKAGFVHNPKAINYKLSIVKDGEQYSVSADFPVVGKLKLTSDNLVNLMNRLNETIFSGEVF